ncbi:hypothetical protein GSI_10074 [Ganoderma sinense ZZ0214-1]|uniref:Integrase catalytic domain-containing protein n=1 Tax=Ganoderma sinense ZZ0214-1 TaxID=1077348 RepID=A0A2G8RZJ0_9APHY|nr:hypothetical protein GSI_10074 [Ganoderma sinense ZZ0214-1]
MAEVIFDHVYKLHGLPERIISDRDSLFTSIFWRTLHALLGTELRLSSSFHPQTDGATERANRTMTQMLRQCVRPDQKDWVLHLPAIELAMNMARSETTGFSPFYLNYGQLPRSLVWQAESPYPGVTAFAARMKAAIMAAHDAIIGARIAQTEQANKKRRKAMFQEGDLVYLSTKNLTIPKGRARKLAPKFLGPFRITKVIVEGATYKLDLPHEMLARGLVNAFHASLLRPHYPSDDRRFPGRLYHQIPGFGENPREWAVDRILSHVGRGSEAEFEVQWSTGDVTWVPHADIQHLQALSEYLEALGVLNVGKLRVAPAPIGSSSTSPPNEGGPDLALNAVRVQLWDAAELENFVLGDRGDIAHYLGYKESVICAEGSNTGPQTFHHHPPELATTDMAPANPNAYNTEDWARWELYAQQLHAHFRGQGRHPGDPPEGYREVYTTRHLYAPLPENRPVPVLQAPNNQGPPQFQGMRGVAMSEDAFAALLQQSNHCANLITRFAENMQNPRPARPARPVTIVTPAPIAPVAPRAHLAGRGRGYGQRGGHRGRGGYNGGRGHAQPPPPPPRGGGLLGRMDRTGLRVQGQRGGRGGGTHSRGRRGGQDRHDRDGGPSGGNAGEPHVDDDSMRRVLDVLADIFGEAGLEDRRQDAVDDPMDVDALHAGGAEPQALDNGNSGRQRSVSPEVESVSKEIRSFEDEGRF